MVTKKIKTTTFKIYTLFILGILLFLGTCFLISRIYKKSNVIRSQRTQMIALVNDVAALDKVLADKQEYNDEMEAVLRSVPSSYRDVAFYQSQIEDIARTRSQSLESALDKNAEPEGQLMTLRYTIKTIGPFPAYNLLLSDLTVLPYHIKIDSLKVEKDSSNVVTSTNFRLYITEE